MNVYKEVGPVAVLVENRLQTLYIHTYIPVFKDGSKDPNTGKTGFAFSIPDLLIYFLYIFLSDIRKT